MSRTRGEGRAPNEKSGHLVPDTQAAREKRARLKAEEKDWAEQAGPVETKKASAATHYCSYCRYYATSPLTGKVDHSKDFTGTRSQVVNHARKHPLGSPEDYPIPLEEPNE